MPRELDPLHQPQPGEVFAVATIVDGQLDDLEMFDRPPTFHLAHNQTCRVANLNCGESAPFRTVGDLLAHLADALGMDTTYESGEPYDGQSLAENLLEAIEVTPADGTWFNTDSRTLFADRLLQTLDQDSVADPDTTIPALASYLHLSDHDGARLIEALLQVALEADDSYCEGCVRSAVAAGEGHRVGEPQRNQPSPNELAKALLVMTLDRQIRPWLERHDPMALQQAEMALMATGHGAELAKANAEPNYGEGDRVVDVRYGTGAVVKHLDRSQRGGDGYGLVVAYDDEPDTPVCTGRDYFRGEPLAVSPWHGRPRRCQPLNPQRKEPPHAPVERFPCRPGRVPAFQPDRRLCVRRLAQSPRAHPRRGG
jgi:hypothetical protein